MNRSILIVICDFLLVSLLAFSTVDINKISDSSPRQIKVDLATNQLDSGKDLTAVMRLALEDERKNRDLLLGELTKARETLNKQQGLLSERERMLSDRETLLSDREKQVQNLQQNLQSREQEAQRLQQEQANLLQQYAAAQTNLQGLSDKLHNASLDALISKEKVAAMDAEVRKQADQANALQKQMAQLQQSNQVILTEKQQLAGQLQVAETEKRLAAQQVTQMQNEVKIQREEKAKLADGVKALATTTGELVQEIRENRPMAANLIFNELATNRVSARLLAVRSGMFGMDASRQKDTETVLVSDGTNIFALCHVDDTPLALGGSSADWQALAGNLTRGGINIPIRSLSFCWPDPRVVLMPVTAAEARQLGSKIYRISSDPFRFPEAILVGAREGYYGECRFQIDLTTPEYLKLDHSFIRGLFGKFNPTRGDLVFSRTGELLGVMANSTYCMMLHRFDSSATLQFGPDVRSQHTGDTLARLYAFVFQLPFRLQ